MFHRVSTQRAVKMCLSVLNTQQDPGIKMIYVVNIVKQQDERQRSRMNQARKGEQRHTEDENK